MIKVIHKYILGFGLLSTVFAVEGKIERPNDLLKYLYSEQGWENIKSTKDGITIKTKRVKGRDLDALMVHKEIMISPDAIADVIMDVGHYGDFLSSAGALKSITLDNTSLYLDGYQHISISIPFFSDRRYCFRITDRDWSVKNEKILVQWILLDKNNKYTKYLQNNDSDAVYLDFGAGVWMASPTSDGTIDISYRLYMDPGGSIPNFIIDMINEVSILNIFKDALAEAARRSETKTASIQ